MKPGWKSSEFWLTLVTGVAKTLLPDLPDEAIWAVIAYILSRTTVKAAEVVTDNK